MRDVLGSADLYAELQMVRTAFKGSVALLEGPDDCLLMDRFVDPSECKTLPGYGRESVIKAVLTADDEAVPGVLGIVDADWWLLDSVTPPSANLVCGDSRDIEIMLVNSRALDRILSEYGSKSKLEAFLTARSESTIRNALRNLLLPVGALRCISYREQLDLRFQRIEIRTYFRLNNLRFDKRRFIERVLQRTANPQLHVDRMVKRLDEEIRKDPDTTHLVRGHDFVALLGHGLRRVLGSRDLDETATHLLERSLRLSFTDTDFKKTGLYKEVKDWEGANTPYVVLRQM